MMIDLPEEDWLTVVLALRQGGAGKHVRAASDRDSCVAVAEKVNGAIKCAAAMTGLVDKLKAPSTTQMPEPATASQAGAWEAVVDFFR
jgi:hypothetical protein